MAKMKDYVRRIEQINNEIIVAELNSDYEYLKELNEEATQLQRTFSKAFIYNCN